MLLFIGGYGIFFCSITNSFPPSIELYKNGILVSRCFVLLPFRTKERWIPFDDIAGISPGYDIDLKKGSTDYKSNMNETFVIPEQYKIKLKNGMAFAIYDEHTNEMVV